MSHYSKRMLCLLLVTAVLCTACAGSGSKDIKNLPEYDTLSTLIGLTKEETLAKMQWQESEFVEDTLSYYKTPLEVDYCGIHFAVLLGINYYDGKVSEIVYSKVYTQDINTATQDLLTVGQTLSSDIGRATKTDDFPLWDMTEEELTEKLEAKKLFKQLYWDLTDSATAAHKSYLEQCQNANYWAQMYRNRTAQYGLSLQVSQISETDTTYLRLSYGMHPIN